MRPKDVGKCPRIPKTYKNFKNVMTKKVKNIFIYHKNCTLDGIRPLFMGHESILEIIKSLGMCPLRAILQKGKRD